MKSYYKVAYIVILYAVYMNSITMLSSVVKFAGLKRKGCFAVFNRSCGKRIFNDPLG